MSGPRSTSSARGRIVARRHGIRFGIGFHDTPARTWGQFMPVRYTSDKTGPMKAVPYDALQTVFGRKRRMVGGHGPGDLLWPGPHCAGSIAFTVRHQFYAAG